MSVADGKRCIRNAAYRYHFFIKTTSTGQHLNDGTNPVVNTVDDGGAAVTATAAETQISTTGLYYVDLTASEMTRTGAIVVVVNTATGTATEYMETLRPEPCQDSGVCQTAAIPATTIKLRSAASSSDDYYNGATVEIVRGTGAGQSRVITDYTGSTTTATVDRAWVTNTDTTSVYIINSAAQSSNLISIDGSTVAVAVMKAMFAGGAVPGTVDMISPTTTSFTCAGLNTSTNDFYVDSYLLFTSGDLSGIARPISDYVAATQTITVATAFPTQPVNTETFVIIGNSS